MNERKMDELIANVDSVLNKSKASSSPNQDKINLFILGQPHHNLFKLIFESCSFTPKNTLEGYFVKAYKCDIYYGDSERLYHLDSSEKKEVDYSYVTNVLSTFDNVINNLRFEYTTNQVWAKDINIHLIVSDNDYADVDWNFINKNADYVLFSLSATALLSMCERKILRTILLPNMGNELGILLTNDNMILSDDRGFIETSLTKVFGDYSSPIFRFPDVDEERLAYFLKELPQKSAKLIEKRQKRARKIELNELLTELKLQIEVLSSDNEKLDDAIELLSEKLQKLPDRKESAFRRARMKYTSKLRIELSEAVSVFHQEFNEALEKEIASNNDVQELEAIIPNYIKKQWESEANVLFDRVQSYSESIGIELKDYINDDIISYIADGISEDFANYVFGLTKMYMKKQPKSNGPVIQVKSFDFELPKDNSKLKKYGVVASGVALVMLSHTIVGIAVAVLGSKKVEKESEKKFVSTNKQALLDASYRMCSDYHSEMDLWIDQMIEFIESHFEQCIAECYHQVIDMMIEAVKNKQQDFSSHDEELGELNRLKNQIEAEINEAN